MKIIGKILTITWLISFKLVYSEMMEAIFHAMNMLKPCDSYNPSMERIYFRYYDRKGKNVHTATVRSRDPIGQCGTKGSTAYGIIIPGWREHCGSKYVRKAIDNLHSYRGGCIICLDYSNYSLTDNYKCLFSKFSEIRDALYLFYLRLEKKGVNFQDIYVFGHSFGSQVALQSAVMLGYRKIGAIDACDPAGILFDASGLMRKLLRNQNPRDVRSAARSVDCWHTSGGYGTLYRLSCDRNWLLGRCGFKQPAAKSNVTSHSLCPIFYNLAFKYTFPVVHNPNLLCQVGNPAKYWPDGFKLGYREKRKKLVYGQVFVNTSKFFPYN